MAKGRGRPKKTVSPPHTPHSKSSSLENHGSSADLQQQSSAYQETIAAHEDTTVKSPEIIVSNVDRKLWVDVLNENQNPTKGRSMKFIAPKVVNGSIEVEIEAADTISEIKFWEPSIVLYALGGELSMNAVKNFMIKNWSFVQLPNMYYHEEGFFFLRFKIFSERDEVLMRGPYMIRGMLLLIRE